MPGPGELRPQQPARIIGRETGLARLRGLVDQVPLASQVLLVTVGGLDRGQVSTCSSFAGAVLSVAPGSGLGESPYRSVGRVSCLRGEMAAWAKAFGGRVSRSPW